MPIRDTDEFEIMGIVGDSRAGEDNSLPFSLTSNQRRVKVLPQADDFTNRRKIQLIQANSVERFRLQ